MTTRPEHKPSGRTGTADDQGHFGAACCADFYDMGQHLGDLRPRLSRTRHRYQEALRRAFVSTDLDAEASYEERGQTGAAGRAPADLAAEQRFEAAKILMVGWINDMFAGRLGGAVVTPRRLW